jgi:putative peptidoglycan lipid II flippase
MISWRRVGSAQHSLERGAVILIVTSGLSYTLGLLRDRALAGTFGASAALDAYQAAFIVPDAIFNLFIAGALTTAFLPVYTDLRTRRRRQEAARLAGTLLSGGLVLLTAVGLAALFFAKPLTALVAPGFPPNQLALLANLTRIMLLSPLLFLISNLLGSMLISNKRFLFYGLSPAFYNLGIILGIAAFAPVFGIYAAAVGTIAGAALHLAIRLVDLRRARLALMPAWRITPPVKKVIKLMLPRLVGLAGTQLQLWMFVAIASTLGEGSVTAWPEISKAFRSASSVSLLPRRFFRCWPKAPVATIKPNTLSTSFAVSR